MPANRLSLQLTTTYRQRLDLARDRLQRLAEERWPSIEELDGTDWPERMAGLVTQAQTEAVRASAGYLTAFLTLELGERTSGPVIATRPYVGKSRDGRPLSEAFQSPVVGVKASLAEGSTVADALAYGLDRARRQVGVDFDASHRQALLEAIDGDDRFEGWQRALRGTCGACAAVAGHVEHGIHFAVHPGCHCVSEPVVKGVPNLFPRATGAELFAAKSDEELDESVGPLAAALLREGRIQLSELVQHEELNSDQPGFITQKPVDQILQATKNP